VTRLFKLLFYGVCVVSGLVVAFFLLANLVGPRGPGETWRNTAMVSLGGLTGMGFIAWALRAGHVRHCWVVGLAIAAAAPFAFALVTFGGLLLFTKVHWQ
jgi:hypothetical protein